MLGSAAGRVGSTCRGRLGHHGHDAAHATHPRQHPPPRRQQQRSAMPAACGGRLAGLAVGAAAGAWAGGARELGASMAR
jgi:hypothetical protein